MFKPSIFAGGSWEENNELEAYLFSVDQLGKSPSSKRDQRSHLLSAQRHPRLSEKLLHEHKNDTFSTDSSNSVTEVETTTGSDSRLGFTMNVKMVDDLVNRNELSDSDISSTKGISRLLTVEQLEEPDPIDHTTSTSVTENKPIFLKEPSGNTSNNSVSVTEEKSLLSTVDQFEEPQLSDHTSSSTASLSGLANIQMVSDLVHSEGHIHSHSTCQSSPKPKAEQVVSPVSNSEMSTASASPSLDSLHDQSSDTIGRYQYTLDSFESDDECSEEGPLHISKSSTAPLCINTRCDLLSGSARDSHNKESRAAVLGKSDHLIKKNVDVGTQTDTAIDTDKHTHMFPWQPAVKSEGGYSDSFLNQHPLLPHIISADALEAVTTYSPAMVALQNLISSQLSLTRHLISQSQQFAERIVAGSLPDHRYTTLQDTKEYINRNRPKVLGYEEALELVKQNLS